VHRRLHFRRSRIAEDAAGAERARSEFHAALKPPDDVVADEKVGDVLEELVFGLESTVPGAQTVEKIADIARRVARPEEAALLTVGLVRTPRLVEQLVPDKERRAERPARVTRGGLNPDFPERTFPKHARVADAVQRDASG